MSKAQPDKSTHCKCCVLVNVCESNLFELFNCFKQQQDQMKQVDLTKQIYIVIYHVALNNYSI